MADKKITEVAVAQSIDNNAYLVITQPDGTTEKVKRASLNSLSEKLLINGKVTLVRATATHNLETVGTRIYLLDESNNATLDASCEIIYAETTEYIIFVKKGGRYYPAQAYKSGRYLYITYTYIDTGDGISKTRQIKFDNNASSNRLTFTETQNYASSTNWYDAAYYYLPPTIEAIQEHVLVLLNNVPDTTTVGVVGDIRICRLNGGIYKCVSTTGGVYTWKAIDGTTEELVTLTASGWSTALSGAGGRNYYKDVVVNYDITNDTTVELVNSDQSLFNACKFQITSVTASTNKIRISCVNKPTSSVQLEVLFHE